MNLFSIYVSLVLFILTVTPRFVGEASNEDDLTSDYESESPKSKSRTHGLLNKHFVLIDCETGFHFWVRQLRFQFWVKPKSGNCGRFQFWAYPKVETADAFPVSGRFHFWACTTSLVQHNKFYEYSTIKDNNGALKSRIF